jgi:hypothetical protein
MAADINNRQNHFNGTENLASAIGVMCFLVTPSEHLLSRQPCVNGASYLRLGSHNAYLSITTEARPYITPDISWSKRLSRAEQR